MLCYFSSFRRPKNCASDEKRRVFFFVVVVVVVVPACLLCFDWLTQPSHPWDVFALWSQRCVFFRFISSFELVERRKKHIKPYSLHSVRGTMTQTRRLGNNFKQRFIPLGLPDKPRGGWLTVQDAGVQVHHHITTVGRVG